MATTARMPRGIPYIIGNEAAERYSYYGMRSILVVFMTQYMMSAAGRPDHMSPDEAKEWYHLFGMAAYFFPLLGALVADIFWGKYHTIMRLSVIYCIGHAVLAFWETRAGLSVGLILIAIGTGGIKPCVAAHVGDQFDKTNQKLLERVFSYFYFAVNFGAFFSILLTPLVLEKIGARLAFGIPGILMFIATVVFWLGRHKFIAIPPSGWGIYKKEVFSAKGKKAFLNLGILYFFIAAFWSLFEQQGSSWVLQAEKMNRMVDLRFGPFQWAWLKFELLSSQISAVNSIIIMVLIPVFTFFIYPLWAKVSKPTSLRKIGFGMFLAGFAFVIIAVAQKLIDTGHTPSIMWQFWAYVVLTAAEIMVSITALEFAYTQAPNSMKSFVMSFYLLSVSFGNSIAAVVNLVIQNPDGSSKLAGASYFWFFVGLVGVFLLGFIFFSTRYHEENYVQKERARN